MTSTLGQAVVVGPSHERPQPAPRRRWVLFRGHRRAASAAILGVLALTATLLVALRGGSPPTIEAFAVATSYHVTYAVTTPTGGQSTEQLWVRRPFDSVDITYAGPPPGRTPSLVVVYRLGVQVLKAATGQAGLLHVPATVAPQDVRADVVVPAALQQHKLKVVGRNRVLGRSCQVFRSAAPIRAGALPALRSRSSYVDSCIDPAGIVLRETQVSAGHVVSDRRAVQVQTGAAALAGAPFDMTGAVTPFDSGGGAFTPLTLDSRPPGSSWTFRSAPAGFTHLGRYAVVPPQPQLFGQGGDGMGSMGLPGGLVTEMDDVFVHGTDVVVLQQGSTLNGAAFTPPANATDVDLGALGQGQLLIAAGGVTIVAEPGNGKGFVRMSGTLSPDRLVELMRGLARQPGGTLTRLPASSPQGGG